MRKRGVIEIIAQMLECLTEGSLRKTHLIYKAGIDTRTAAKYVSFLLAHAFIERSKDEESHFALTQKGREFLRIYHNLLQSFGATETLEINIKA